MNLVNRLRFDLTCEGESQAFHVRHLVAHSHQASIIDTMERITSRYDTKGIPIVVDKIVIDLGKLSMQEFERSFVQQFEQNFERELLERLLAPESEVAVPQPSQLAEELFKQFALTGSVPWWFTGTQEVFFEMILQAIKEHTRAVTSFLYAQEANRQLWKRLSLQLPAEALLSIISRFENLERSVSFIKEWSAITNHRVVGKGFEFDANNIASITIRYAPFLLRSKSLREDAAVLFASILLDTPGEILTSQETNEVFQKISVLTGIDLTHAAVKHFWQEFNETVSSKVYDTGSQENLLADQDVNDADAIMIHDAGLVLVAPFLPSFFSRLELTENKKWKDRESLYRGIHLLYFIATGEQCPPEYLLSFEKLLCGCPLEEPVPGHIELTVREKEEVESLLQSVIGHWSVLKNTSVNGLREAFLKRQGRLQKGENGWDLLVERKTIDVLVDQLPWSFSLLHFPWNFYLIYVQW